MQKVLIGIIILHILTSSLLLAADKKKIKSAENYLAVLDIESVGKVEKDLVRPLTDSIRREIVKADKYEVMDRGNMDEVLKEQALQMTGCTSKECAVEVGQLLGVGKIVVGSVSLVGKTYLLSLSLVNVETGKVEQVEDQECKCEVDDLIKLSKLVAGKLMGLTVAATVVQTSIVKSGTNSAMTTKDKQLNCHQTDGRFCDHGDGTVSDAKTNLMWQQKDNGLAKNWNDAGAYCKGLLLAKKNNWRLPKQDELFTLVDKTRENPAINIIYFPEAQPASYWSSTTIESDTRYASVVYFYNGFAGYDKKMRAYYLRCVR